jgi:hypothetical protein
MCKCDIEKMYKNHISSMFDKQFQKLNHNYLWKMLLANESKTGKNSNKQ